MALVWLLLVVAGQVAAAAPASAHAELVRTTPADGARLDRPPAEVTLRFSESVDLLDHGIRLLGADGRAVPTPDPVVDGSTVRWRVPADLPDGGYVVSWRVISSDSHPVAGAFSFGVGALAPQVTDTGVLPPEAPWPVVLVRFLGYLGFALVAGSVAVAVLCWPDAGRGGRPLRLLRGGLVLSAVATVAGLLLQGPYAAGEPLTRLFDRSLVAETGHTDFAAWTQLRLFLVLAIAALVWARGSLDVTLNRWLTVMCVGGAAVTFSGTGHAAASGALLARATDSLHALLAGVWVGGLVVLAVGLAGRPGGDGRPGRPGGAALGRFSRLAMVSVAGLLLTGTVNAVLRLAAWSDLWESRYGVVLLVKLALVAAVLAVAAVSRRAVRHGAEPRRTVLAEVGVTVAILAVTSLLASTVPPATQPAQAKPASVVDSASVSFDLGSGRRVVLDVAPAETGGRTGTGATAGSRLRLELRSGDGRPLGVRSVALRAELPSRGLAPFDITLRGGPSTWAGRFRFPYAGAWKLTLTAELPDRTALVTAATLPVA